MGIVAILKRVIARTLPASYHTKKRVALELTHGEPELKLLRLLADPNKDFIDVGANDGAYAYYGLQYFRRIVAIEAHPVHIKRLRKSLGSRGTVLNVALSDHDGIAKLWVPLYDGRDLTTRSSLVPHANPGFEQREVTVNITSLDALDLDTVGVIKIDVEGHEFDVLNGARETLIAAKPICIVECEERHNSGGVARVFKFFSEIGYRSFYLHNDKLCDGELFNMAVLQRPDDYKSVGGGRGADYVNNFIFIHKQNDAAIARIRSVYPSA